MNERGQWQHLVKFQDDISLNMLQQLSVLCPNFFVNGALLFFLAQGNLQDLYECPSTSVWIKNLKKKQRGGQRSSLFRADRISRQEQEKKKPTRRKKKKPQKILEQNDAPEESEV